MFFAKTLDSRDDVLLESVKCFLPTRIFDIHAHLHDARYFSPDAWQTLTDVSPLGCEQHRASIQRILRPNVLPANISGLYFPLPHASADRPGVNAWIAGEVKSHGGSACRSLILAAPGDGAEALARRMRRRE